MQSLQWGWPGRFSHQPLQSISLEIVRRRKSQKIEAEAEAEAEEKQKQKQRCLMEQRGWTDDGGIRWMEGCRGQNNTRNGQYGTITEKGTQNTENTVHWLVPVYVGVSKFE